MENELIDTYTAYEDLANAIIIRAVDDYEKALASKDDYKIKSIEKFFKSDWYSILSKVDGNYILSKIKSKFKR